jgi:hypothetical protein
MHRILLLIDKIYSIFVMTDKTNDNLNMTHQSTRIGKQKITIKNDRQNDLFKSTDVIINKFVFKLHIEMK